MILIFFAGLGLNGFEAISLVYVSEISADKFRNYSTVILNCSWAIAQILYSFVSLYLQNWRYVCTVFIGIPSLLLVFVCNKSLLETPRYFVSKNMYEEARVVLDKICLQNKRPRFQYRLEGEMQEGLDYHQKQNQQNLQVHNYNYLDLFRFPSLRKITLCMMLLWVFRYIIYYGQTFSLSSLGAEMHSNLTFTAMSEIVATLLSAPIKMKMKRVQSLFWFSLITGIACVSLFFLQMPSQCYFLGQTCVQKALITLFAILIRFGISIYGNILITFTSEKYPTVVRSIGYGLSITSGKIVTIFVPIIVVQILYYELNPLAFFGIIGIVVAILAKFMNESQGQEMKDQIQEMIENENALIELENIGGFSNKALKQNLLK
ncbi:major facilitator superfamily protein, putative [Ichthyophthirius multifiliis]|uniref:Major facilitator superfamily protein, putative n=1 Tax=Ichthyophthirius multifiliis TaxID=5932 RepID=G0QV30_ICHMU|nr:major facilitator superfamily protein, putative [Ichthyophthirius multifiliis]EGR30923.1 major facilitator superfamily protein, putative [Ichthyophthirius multifiliis]|eukprot:XP_004032510.1 major facilitator superfamily protein, putative [Ichthyophthirius multifiliis]